MNQEITIAIIGVSSALLGTVAGGFISYFSSKSIKLLELKNNTQAQTIKERKSLCTQFLKEGNSLILRSEKHKIDSILELEKLTGLFSQIQLSSDDEVTQSASDIVLYVSEAHLKNHNVTGEKKYPELRKKFITAARMELLKIKND